MKYKYKQKMFYANELTTELGDFNITPIKIDENYKYIHKNPFYKLFAFFMYYIFARIAVWFYLKFKGIKIVNKKVLKKCKKGGYFVYANHTSQLIDGFHPTYTCSPKKPHIICNADNVSMKFIGKLTRVWGAIPLPDTIGATRNFNNAIETILKNNNPIVIYPEAHLWPYYTKIRPFEDKSFRYPVKYNKPIYTFTTTYQLKKEGKPPKVTIFVDGPFYPNTNLSQQEQREELRNIAYNTMVERSKKSNYEYLTYIKTKEEKND